MATAVAVAGSSSSSKVLTADQARPVLQSLHRKINGFGEGRDISSATYLTDQVGPLADALTEFQNVRLEMNHLELGTLINRMAEQFFDLPETTAEPNKQFTIYVNSEANPNGLGFNDTHAGHDADGARVSISLNDTFQTFVVGKENLIASTAQSAAGIDLSARSHVYVHIEPASVPSSHSKCFSLSKLLTFAVVVGVIAVATEYFTGCGSTHVAPLLSRTCESVPYCSEAVETVTPYWNTAVDTVSPYWNSAVDTVTPYCNTAIEAAQKLKFW